MELSSDPVIQAEIEAAILRRATAQAEAVPATQAAPARDAASAAPLAMERPARRGARL